LALYLLLFTKYLVFLAQKPHQINPRHNMPKGKIDGNKQMIVLYTSETLLVLK
jgi:hypothetical protein